MDSASQQACDAMVCPVAMTEVMKLAAVSYLYHLLCSPSSLANYFSTHYLGANSVIYCIGIHMKIMLVMFVQSSVLNIFHIHVRQLYVVTALYIITQVHATDYASVITMGVWA